MKLKALAWEHWHVPTTGQFELYCEVWKQYLAAKRSAEVRAILPRNRVG